MNARTKTARRQRTTYPVQNLRVQVSALETAVAKVLAKPGQRAVHELRSATRRIEAHLETFAELGKQESGFRLAEQRAKQVKKLLAVVRRAAGNVRDLDVQARLARESLEKGASATLRHEVKAFRAHLKSHRVASAAKLLKVLDGHGRKLGPQLERLMLAVEPVETIGLSPVEQEVLIRGWYAERVEEARRETEPELTLHQIRKAAKLARYMADSGLSERVVREFRVLQEAGGRWHDCLELRDAVKEVLGTRSALLNVIKEQETEARRAFETVVAG